MKLYTYISGNERGKRLVWRVFPCYSSTSIPSLKFLVQCYLRLHLEAACTCTEISGVPDGVRRVCGLAVYPCFKASVSLMSLCCKRSSPGLLTCSAFQTRAALQHAHTDRSAFSTSRTESCTVMLVRCVPEHWLLASSTEWELVDEAAFLTGFAHVFLLPFPHLLLHIPLRCSLTSCLCISLSIPPPPVSQPACPSLY